MALKTTDTKGKTPSMGRALWWCVASHFVQNLPA
ncbi:hypothetical protein T03_3281 [Trichinella britovi]|uniref:Uncharacterized protein n=1 Tax=Trichinella britovi TaxID=45882 RepID=A0A0V0Z7I6_TRIBR|nr:hypothetical protein T03_3281 [Trichinella britovi]